jgi:hypothetical protein
MRRADVLIYEARRISRNLPNDSGDKAISDDECLIYLNDAQDRLQHLISSKKNIAKIFSTQQIIDIVAGQESYAIEDRLLLNKQIDMVEYSVDGTQGNYVLLKKVELFNRDTNSSMYPWSYYKLGGEIYLQPLPSVSQGTIRVTYERELDDLDIPRGLVSSISGTSTGFTTITLDSSADAYESTTPGWTNIQWCCVVDTYGARKCYNIGNGGYNTGTNVLDPSGVVPFPYTSLDSQISIDDVLVFNRYTTTFSQLPDTCERYLIHYLAMELLNRDSSNDYSKQVDRVAAMENDILTALASQTSEIQYVPTLSNEWW